MAYILKFATGQTLRHAQGEIAGCSNIWRDKREHMNGSQGVMNLVKAK